MDRVSGPLDRIRHLSNGQAAAEACRVKLNPHQFRHDFSHRWLAAGGAESDLMELNGWASAAMVRRYTASAASELARDHYEQIMMHERVKRRIVWVRRVQAGAR